eukprot:g156.t1
MLGRSRCTAYHWGKPMMRRTSPLTVDGFHGTRLEYLSTIQTLTKRPAKVLCTKRARAFCRGGRGIRSGQLQPFLEIYRDASDLYGLIHARYIVSPRGLQAMREKYLKGVFGTCPRVLCDRQHTLPMGLSEELRAAQVKIFCPKCEQVYTAKSKYRELDGAFFGMSFPQIFLQTYPTLTPLELPRPFVPRVFGLNLNSSSRIAIC